MLTGDKGAKGKRVNQSEGGGTLAGSLGTARVELGADALGDEAADETPESDMACTFHKLGQYSTRRGERRKSRERGAPDQSWRCSPVRARPG